MAANTGFVIVGAGLAGAKAAQTLREEGFGGPIVLLGEESGRPYERPPLPPQQPVSVHPHVHNGALTQKTIPGDCSHHRDSEDRFDQDPAMVTPPAPRGCRDVAGHPLIGPDDEPPKTPTA